MQSPLIEIENIEKIKGHNLYPQTWNYYHNHHNFILTIIMLLLAVLLSQDLLMVM